MAQPHTSKTTVIAHGLSVLVMVLALTFFASNHALAQGTDEQRRAAIANAVDQAGGFGKVLSVKPYETRDGKPGFRIRVLTDGKVRTFDVPAKQSQ